MKCNQNPKEDCYNEKLERCKTCIAPMWCLCTRSEVVEMKNKLWEEAERAVSTKEVNC